MTNVVTLRATPKARILAELQDFARAMVSVVDELEAKGPRWKDLDLRTLVKNFCASEKISLYELSQMVGFRVGERHQTGGLSGLMGGRGTTLDKVVNLADIMGLDPGQVVHSWKISRARLIATHGGVPKKKAKG